MTNRGEPDKIMEKRKKVRRNYLLDKSFQIRFVCVNILLQLCAAALAGFLFSYLYLFVFTDEKIVCRHNYALFLQWSILVALLSIVFIIWGIVYTHRIIGPVYKTQMLLRAAASGKIPEGKIKFRKNDSFKGLGDDLTGCFEYMRRQRDAIFKSSNIGKRKQSRGNL